MSGAVHFLCVVTCLACLAAPSLEVRAEVMRYEYTLGLKDKGLRTRQGAEALKERLHKRLQAAGIHQQSISVDGARGEVRVKLTGRLPPKVVRALLVDTGKVEALEVAQAAGVLEDLRALLPDGVTLGHSRDGSLRDTYLYSPSASTLKGFVSGVALSEFRVLVGPAHQDGGGSRTWLVDRSFQGVVGAADAVTIDSGAHPNYHYVTAWWKNLPSARPGTHWLIVVDDRVITRFGTGSLSDDGRVTIRMPEGPAARQLGKARWLAARLCAPHPSGVVVITEKVSRQE